MSTIPKLDSRYSIRPEFTGHRSGKPRLVARFCGFWIGEAPNRYEARALCLAHRRKFVTQLQCHRCNGWRGEHTCEK